MSVLIALGYTLENENIIRFNNVYPQIGLMEDFPALAEGARQIRLRVVLDINLASYERPALLGGSLACGPVLRIQHLLRPHERLVTNGEPSL
ncbi:hypothetical protein HPB48_023603 [Haemaphysalis longicornis]|uniref:Uncharacterized protein n=1 Tax=Haemaphysalis longicornis TaxID=44386 RepID=A0A9J6H5H0_HAELO|nr:hypothetical protein HPB48_023603 [Haemaphysalis longicornis]